MVEQELAREAVGEWQWFRNVRCGHADSIGKRRTTTRYDATPCRTVNCSFVSVAFTRAELSLRHIPLSQRGDCDSSERERLAVCLERRQWQTFEVSVDGRARDAEVAGGGRH